jgi:hypothetical protein
MRLADNELQVFHELLEQMDSVQEIESLITTMELESANQAKGREGEQLLLKHLRAQQWHTLGRAPDQPVNLPGPDAVAWKRLPDGRLELWIIDNKAHGQRLVNKAEALQPKSMIRNLAPILRDLNRHPIHLKLREGMAAQALLWRALRNLVLGKGLPAEICRVVTNAGGQSDGITRPLAASGVLFRDVGKPLASCLPTKPQVPAAQKELAELLGLAVP